MQVTQSAGRTNAGKTAAESQGLAGWLLGFVRRQNGARHAHQRLMRVVETLPLSGKRQLMLVSCGEEHFLIGGSLESVETIVQVKGCASIEKQGGICL